MGVSAFHQVITLDDGKKKRGVEGSNKGVKDSELGAVEGGRRRAGGGGGREKKCRT